MTEKKAIMVLQVDLQCPCCYKKIQKILCKIPEITDKVFEEKAKMVMITVNCCCPEKIRDKLCCKGGKIIKSIEIKEPSKPPAHKPNDAKKPEDAPPPDSQKKPPPPEPTPCLQVVLLPVHPANPCCGPCHEGHVTELCYYGYGFPLLVMVYKAQQLDMI